MLHWCICFILPCNFVYSAFIVRLLSFSHGRRISIHSYVSSALVKGNRYFIFVAHSIIFGVCFGPVFSVQKKCDGFICSIKTLCFKMNRKLFPRSRKKFMFRKLVHNLLKNVQILHSNLVLTHKHTHKKDSYNI